MVGGAPAAFTDDENWHGGFYELAVVLGSRDDARLDAAVRAAWADPRVDGCCVDRHREPEDQQSVPCSLAAHTEVDHLQGYLQFRGVGGRGNT